MMAATPVLVWKTVKENCPNPVAKAIQLRLPVNSASLTNLP
jgi:hypothetical protein